MVTIIMINKDKNNENQNKNKINQDKISKY